MPILRAAFMVEDRVIFILQSITIVGVQLRLDVRNILDSYSKTVRLDASVISSHMVAAAFKVNSNVHQIRDRTYLNTFDTVVRIMQGDYQTDRMSRGGVCLSTMLLCLC